jgi:hypothetical protein
VRRAVLVLAFLTACGLRPTQRAQLTDDQPAPDFTLTSHTGAKVALADGLGAGHVVLVFYRGHW